MLQFYIKHGCLNLIHSRIPSLVIKNIFPGTSIIAQRPDYLSQIIVIRGHGTRITQCTQILTRIKAVSGSSAQTSRPLAVFTIDAAMRLRIVFKQQQMMLLADSYHAWRNTAFAVKMHGEQGAGLPGDMALDE